MLGCNSALMSIFSSNADRPKVIGFMGRSGCTYNSTLPLRPVYLPAYVGTYIEVPPMSMGGYGSSEVPCESVMSGNVNANVRSRSMSEKCPEKISVRGRRKP